VEGCHQTARGNRKSASKIVLGGLPFGVFTLTVSSALTCDYMLRCRRDRGDVRLSRAFKVFAGFLCLAIVLFFVRCCCRIDESSRGYSGEKVELVHNEGLFIRLEGV
jgi:hypothetical protein